VQDYLLNLSQNMQCTVFLSYFTYGLASLIVMVSDIPTPRSLMCGTAEVSVPVVASRERTVYALASAISIHSLM